MTKLNFQLNKKGGDYIELRFLFFTLLLVSSLLGVNSVMGNNVHDLRMQEHAIDPSDPNSQFGQSLATTSESDLGRDAYDDVVSEIKSNLSGTGELYGNGTPLITGDGAEAQNAPTVVSAGIDEVPTMLPSTYASDGREDYGIWKSEPVSIYDTHVQLRDGSFTPKYPQGYWGKGVDHNNLYGSQMSVIEKWWRGIVKGGGKSILYINRDFWGGLLGMLATANIGSIYASYDNDFVDFCADMETRLNLSFANYRTKKERRMNLGETMTTANFWADSVGSSLSFSGATVFNICIYFCSYRLNIPIYITSILFLGIGIFTGIVLGKIKSKNKQNEIH